MSERRQRLFALAVPLAVVLSMLGLVEWGLRTFAPVHLTGIQDAYVYDPDLGYRLASGIHLFELTDHLEEVRTNALGTVNFQEQFGGYPALVFAVGDSYTQGTGLPADASYPFQLDLLLNLDERGFYRERYGVVNLGLAAFGAEQSILALRRYEKLLGRPAFVLYLGCDNDWDDDVLFKSGYRHRHLVAGSPRWGWRVRPLIWLGSFELVERGKLALAELRRDRLVSAADEATLSSGARAPSVAEREWPAIERIAALSSDWGAKLVISWANPGGDSYAWLRAKAAEQGIPFADWEPAVASVRERMPGLPFANRHSGGHWRTWSNAVIARSYARAMGVLPDANGP